MVLLHWNYRRPSRSTGLPTAARCSTIRCSHRQQEGQANPTWSRRKTYICCLAGQQCIRARAPVQLGSACAFEHQPDVEGQQRAWPFFPQPQGSELMPQTGLGVALKTLRERRTLSLREIGQLSSVDHAYVHRLETGEKTNPSQDLVEKLLKVLKPGERDAALVMWLVDHADADPGLVEFVLQDPSISIDVFSAAAGVRHRGNARPDPATLIARIKKAFDDDEDD